MGPPQGGGKMVPGGGPGTGKNKIIIILNRQSVHLVYYVYRKTGISFAVKNPRSAIDIRNRPRIPIPDEDPYSIAGSGSSGSSGNGNRERSRDKPPKLPPRDTNGIYGTTGVPRVNNYS